METTPISKIHSLFDELQTLEFNSFILIIPNLQSLLKVLKKILDQPFEKKYRSFNLKSEIGKRLWENEYCHLFLENLGFCLYDEDGINRWILQDEFVSIYLLEESIRGLQSILQDFTHEHTQVNLTSQTYVDDLLSTDSQLQTQLHHAAAQGNASLVRIICSKYPHMISQPDVNGWIPLFEAIRSNHIEVVLLLIEYENSNSSSPSPNPNPYPSFRFHRSSNGGNSLWWSRHFKRREIEEILKSAGVVPDPDEPPSSSFSPWDWDGQSGCAICGKVLRAVEMRGRSALMHAPHPWAAVECLTCKEEEKERRERGGEGKRGAEDLGKPFVICGECYNFNRQLAPLSSPSPPSPPSTPPLYSPLPMTLGPTPSPSHFPTLTHSTPSHIPHPPDHIFQLVGSEEAGFRGSRGRAPPPPPPNARNHRGPWG